MLRSTVIDTFHYREVLLSFISQDLKIKYKRTSLGYLWSLLNPILQLAVMAVVFTHIVGRGVDNYTQFLFSGLLAWTFFQSAVLISSRAFLDSENFIKKVYLPKFIFPLSKVCLRAVDFIFSLVALSVIGLIIGFHYGASIALLPVAVALLFIFTLGVSVFVAIFTVYFRDLEYLLSVFLQLLYFLTPVLYPLTAMPEKYRAYFALNPVYPQVRVFQQIIYAGVWPSVGDWMSMLITSVGVFMIGLICLRLTEEDLVFRL